MKHQEQIICVPSSVVSHRKDGFVNYTLNAKDLMTGQRASLENNEAFRQIIPISIYICDCKVWAYYRTASSGESRLHDKVAVGVGGHWDITDLILNDGVPDIEASLKEGAERELGEEIILESAILQSTTLPQIICADDTDVDRVHMAVVTMHILDGDKLSVNEDQLEAIGFRHPVDLLSSSEYDLETWARMICEMLINQGQRSTSMPSRPAS